LAYYTLKGLPQSHQKKADDIRPSECGCKWTFSTNEAEGMQDNSRKSNMFPRQHHLCKFEVTIGVTMAKQGGVRIHKCSTPPLHSLLGIVLSI